MKNKGTILIFLTIFLVALSSMVVSADLLTNAKYYYKLDEGSGTTAYDSLGSGVNIILSSSSMWTTDDKLGGYALKPAIGPVYATWGTTSTFNRIHQASGDWTLSWWYYIDSNLQGASVIFSSSSGGDNNGFHWSGNQTYTYFFIGSILGASPLQIYNTSLANHGTGWHMYTMTYNSSNNPKYTGYVDGVVVGAGNNVHSYGTGDAQGALIIGNYYSPGNSFVYENPIDEIGYWERSFSATEVTTLYNSNTGCAYNFSACEVTVTICNSNLSNTPCTINNTAFNYSSGNVLVEFSNINGTINTSDIITGSNWVWINSSSALNVPARITFNSLSHPFVYPVRDGERCTTQCTNTIISGASLTFNVTGFSNYTYGDNPFTADWDTNLTTTGSSNASQIMLPLEEGGTYNFSVDWGDGTWSNITSWNQAEVIHNYASIGISEVNIYGTINGFRFNNLGDRNKLRQIRHWGDLNLGNNGSYFYGCQWLGLQPTDNLNLTGTTNFYRAFRGTYIGLPLYDNLSTFNNWDVSQITNFQEAFYGTTNFNFNLSNWNTSSATSMRSMFFGSNITSDLSNWDVSNVQTFQSTFNGASYFNSNITGWDTHNATNMVAMFNNAYLFNQPIGTWNVSRVTTMQQMFAGTTAPTIFNHPLNDWDVSKVTNMYAMFYNNQDFNQSLDQWDTSSVTNTSGMFEATYSFDQDLSNWNISSLLSAEDMFGAVVWEDNITLSVANYDALLLGWSSQPHQSNVLFGAGTSQYTSAAKTARSILISDGWTIIDGGYLSSLNGTGTLEDPYQVTNCSQLQEISFMNNAAYYELSNDIDCSDTINWNGGLGFSPLLYLGAGGVFNGSGHVISNLFMNSTSLGLFSTSYGLITNLGLENISFWGSATSNNINQGGLITRNRGTISNVYVTGKITSNNYPIGGIAGFNGHDSSITNSYSRVNIYKIGINNPQWTGGAIGYTGFASQSNLYSTGYVQSNIGGGLIGDGSSGVSNSFWDNETSNKSTSFGGGTGLTTNLMMNKYKFETAGWNFTDVWQSCPDINDGYPSLRVFGGYNASCNLAHPFDNESYTISFPHLNEAITTNNTLSYGFETTDPFYDYTSYLITDLTTDITTNYSTTDTTYSTILPDGKYYYALTINDVLGGSQYYDPNITIDTTPPSISYSTGSNSLVTGLVSYWKFDENSGNTLIDSIGNNDVPRHATNTYNTSSKNGSSSLDCPRVNDAVQGYGSYANITLPTGSDITDLTFCAWVAPRTNPGMTFYQLATTIGKYGANGGFSLGKDNTNLYYMALAESSVLRAYSLSAPQDIWALECGVWHTSNHSAEFYVNGSLIGSATVPLFNITSTTNISFCTGNDNNAFTYNTFYGRVDEVMLWSRTLTPIEMTSLTNGELPANTGLPSTQNNSYLNTPNIFVAVDVYDANINHTNIYLYNTSGLYASTASFTPDPNPPAYNCTPVGFQSWSTCEFYQTPGDIKTVTKSGAPNTTWQHMEIDSDASTIFAQSESGIYLSTDYGVSFNTITNPGCSNAISITNDGSTLYCVATGDAPTTLYKSTNDGSSWTTITIPWTLYLYNSGAQKMYVSDDGQTLLIIPENYGYYKVSSDEGLNWTELFPTGNYDGYGLSGDGLTIWGGGDRYKRWNYNGSTWNYQYLGGPQKLSTNFFVNYDATKVVWTTNTGIMREGFNGYTGFPAQVISMSGTTGETIVAANGTDGTHSQLWISNNHGQTWTYLSDMGDRWWNNIRISDDGYKVVVTSYNGAGDGGIWIYDQGPESNGNGVVSKNFTELPNGVYYYNATSSDLAGNQNSTITWMSTVHGAFESNLYTVTFPYPENTYTTNNNLTYGFTTSDAFYNYAEYTLHSYNNSSTTNTSTSNQNITHILPDGKYYYGLTIYDLASNYHYYDPNITIDTTNPSLNYNANTTASNSFIGPSANIYVSVNMSDANINTTEIRLYNSTGNLINSTSSNSNGTLSINFTDLVNGVYYFNVTTSDLVGLTTNLATRTATIIDSFQSQLYNVSFPYPDETYTINNTLTHSFTTIDPYYDYTVYNLTNITGGNVTGLTTTTNNSISYTLIDGKYYYGLTIYDLAGNSQYYDPNVTIDTTYPSLEYNANTTPDNAYVGPNANIYVSVNMSDANIQGTYIRLYNSTNDLINTMYSNSNGTLSMNFTSLANGVYYFNVTSNDFANLTTILPTRTATVISSFQSQWYNVTFPYADNAYTTNTTLFYGFETTDPYYDYTEYTLTNYTNNATTNVTTPDWNKTQVMLDGKYYYGLRIYDLAGNNQYYDPNITIDTTNPLIEFIPFTEINGSTVDTKLYLNVTINTSDTNYWKTDIYMYNSTGLQEQYTTNTPGIIPYAFNITTNGWYYLNATTTDYAGLTNSTETREVLIDSYKTNITFNGFERTTNNTIPFNVLIYVVPGPLVENISVTNRTLTTQLLKSSLLPHAVIFTADNPYYNCTTNWVYQSDYEFPTCEYYTTNTTIYTYNSYTNTTISNFTTTATMNAYPLYSETQTANGTSLIYNLTNPNLYNLEITHPSYLTKTKTYTPSGYNQTLNESMNQSIITLRFFHVYSDQLITNINITVTDTSYNRTFNTNGTGLITFNPNTGSHILSINGSRYNILTYNLTVTDQQIQTIDINLYPILNISVYEEKQSMIILTYFNFSHPRLFKWTVYCLDENGSDIGTQQALITNTTTGAYFLNATCYYERVRFDLEYLNLDGTTENYYRNVIFLPTIDLFDFKTFIPDLALGYNIYPTTLKPYDILGVYTTDTHTQVQVTKIMPTGTELITSDYVDAEGKITAYLIAGDSYIITILADGQPARILGPYSADSTGTKILRLFDVTIVSDVQTIGKDIYIATEAQNITDIGGIIVMQFADVGLKTDELIMSMYNTSCDETNVGVDTPVITDTLNSAELELVEHRAQLTMNVLSSPYMNKTSNQQYCAVYNYSLIDEDTGAVSTYQTKTNIVYDKFIARPGQFASEWTFPWIVVLILFIIAMGLNARTASKGSILIVAIVGLIYGIGWFRTTGIDQGILGIAVAFIMILAIGWNLKKEL